MRTLFYLSFPGHDFFFNGDGEFLTEYSTNDARFDPQYMQRILNDYEIEIETVEPDHERWADFRALIANRYDWAEKKLDSYEQF